MTAGRPARVWLFDLDNTLHNATPAIFPHINRAMRDYIARHLTVDLEKAGKIRQHYWERYGATLLGMIRHHGTDPRHFLRETHQFPDLKRLLHFEKPVVHALKRLPGRKILFSNGPRAYTDEVLRLTGLAPCFDAVYAVDNVKFRPKPLRAAFQHVLHKERLAPGRCIMVEDSLANLATAKRLGMRTVWVTPGARRSPWVDVQIRSVVELPGRHGRL